MKQAAALLIIIAAFAYASNEDFKAQSTAKIADEPDFCQWSESVGATNSPIYVDECNQR